MPLPIALGADIDRHPAIALENHFGPFGGVAQNALDIVTQPLPPQQAAFGIRRPARGKTVAVGLLPHPGQQACKIAHIVKLARGSGIGELLRLDEVDPP